MSVVSLEGYRLILWIVGALAGIVVIACGFGVNIVNQKITERDKADKKIVGHMAHEPAYVFLDPDKSLEAITLEVGKPPSALLRVKNVGKSQAFDLVAWRRIAVGPWPLPGDFNFPLQKEGQPSKIAQPGEVTYWAIHDPSNPPITQTQYDQLKAGVVRLYIYGRIEYKDGLGENRWTNFCLAIVPSTDPQQAAGFGLQRAARNNDSDMIGRL